MGSGLAAEWFTARRAYHSHRHPFAAECLVGGDGEGDLAPVAMMMTSGSPSA